jgi:hypothetical protein
VASTSEKDNRKNTPSTHALNACDEIVVEFG